MRMALSNEHVHMRACGAVVWNTCMRLNWEHAEV